MEEVREKWDGEEKGRKGKEKEGEGQRKEEFKKV